jgi:predicted RNase H-like HicB family nuclease
MQRTLEDYRALHYSRRAEAVYEGSGPPYWVAWIEELPGCKTDGATFPEAILNLDSAFDDYIEAMLGFGSHIPEPVRKNKVAGMEVTVDEIVEQYSNECLRSVISDQAVGEESSFATDMQIREVSEHNNTFTSVPAHS